MGNVLRFHPCIKKIKDIIDNKELGKILSVYVENGSYLPDWHPYENYKKSYASRKDLADILRILYFVQVAVLHGTGVEGGDLIIVNVRGYECLGCKFTLHVPDVATGNA